MLGYLLNCERYTRLAHQYGVLHIKNSAHKSSLSEISRYGYHRC